VRERLRIHPENVVHEEVDGEVIAIDLSGGAYYSIAGSGTAIWAQLAAGASEEEIRAAVATRFDADPETVAGEVAGLLERLRECGLVVAVEQEGETPTLPPAAGEKEPFEPPRFERYTDMKDYFLLDPIHEVDAAGWPKPAG
jgi:hypothetical protein